jgi:hypothetical protein
MPGQAPGMTPSKAVPLTVVDTDQPRKRVDACAFRLLVDNDFFNN